MITRAEYIANMSKIALLTIALHKNQLSSDEQLELQELIDKNDEFANHHYGLNDDE